MRALGVASRRAQFFECLPVACYACDCAGAITDYNSRSVELWGREPRTTDRFTAAHKLLDAQGNPLAPQATAAAVLLRSGLAQLTDQELVIEKPDGHRVVVLSNATLLRNEKGEVTGVLDVLQDITGRRWAEDARRVAERLGASARVAAEVAQLKPALLSTVSLLDRLCCDSTLSVQARGYTELARSELVHFDALMQEMALLAGAA